MKAFQTKVNGKMLDYRLGEELNLDEVKAFFGKKYQVIKLWSSGRHIVGDLKKDKQRLWLKLATTVGISALTQNEFTWNEQFNLEVPRSSSSYWVPKNYTSGFYHDLFYLITDKLEGKLLVGRPEKSSGSKVILENLSSIIGFTETIQKLKLKNLNVIASEAWQSSHVNEIASSFSTPRNDDDAGTIHYHQEYFFKKTQLWFQDIPEMVREKYQVPQLLKMVESSSLKLQSRTRHGDFTPWHLMLLKNGQLGLLDGEHAMGNGVENYDLGYFLQRVYSVLEDSVLAKKILELLIKRGYKTEKLKPVLAARAIGGFLDEALKEKPDYQIAASFQEFVQSI